MTDIRFNIHNSNPGHVKSNGNLCCNLISNWFSDSYYPYVKVNKTCCKYQLNFENCKAPHMK